MTNQQWLDTLGEEGTLLLIGAALYHYDSGLSHDDDSAFYDDEWTTVFEPIIQYVKKHLGGMYVSDLFGKWYSAEARRQPEEGARG